MIVNREERKQAKELSQSLTYVNITVSYSYLIINLICVLIYIGWTLPLSATYDLIIVIESGRKPLIHFGRNGYKGLVHIVCTQTAFLRFFIQSRSSSRLVANQG